MSTSTPPIAFADDVSDHPVRLDIDYPDRPLDRVSTLLRPILILPIMLILALIGGSTAGGLIVLPTILMIAARRKYPRWWFDFNRELARFSARVCAYLALMDDRYPSTDAEQSVRLEFDYPDAEEELDRWLPLVKWLLAIPHFIMLAFLFVASFFVVLYAWVMILATGRYPRGAFDFLVGVGRWNARVVGYALLCVTDRYPPFSLH